MIVRIPVGGVSGAVIALGIIAATTSETGHLSPLNAVFGLVAIGTIVGSLGAPSPARTAGRALAKATMPPPSAPPRGRPANQVRFDDDDTTPLVRPTKPRAARR